MSRPTDPKKVVIKIGTTSIVGSEGEPERKVLGKITSQVATLVERGTSCVIVSSGAIAAGMGPLGLKKRPTDMPSLQAAAAVGQRVLMDLYADLLKPRGMIVGQVLLTQQDIVQRSQYNNARNTLSRLLDLGVVPIVNENDTVAVEEIRYGDNDRLAAFVANLIGADLLIILSDVEGLFTKNPSSPGAQLISTVDEIDGKIASAARGISALGSGGMASKLEAAKMATASAVGTVVASAAAKDVLLKICAGDEVGTYFMPRRSKMQARKLWIAWAPASKGRVLIDDGALSAITDGKKSLLAAGVSGIEGEFSSGDPVEVVSASGGVVAKGLVMMDSEILRQVAGRKGAGEAINRDSLVVL